MREGGQAVKLLLPPASLADCSLEAGAIYRDTKFRLHLRCLRCAVAVEAISVFIASEYKGFPLPDNGGEVLPMLAGLALSDINLRIAEHNAAMQPATPLKYHHGNL